MRILVMTPWTGFWSVGPAGGVPDEFLTFRALVRRGHDLHVLAARGAGYALPDEGPGRFTCHPSCFPSRFVLSRYLGQLARLRDLVLAWRAFGRQGAALARELEPDLLLAHSAFSAPWASAIAHRRGIPVVAKLFGVMLLNTGWRPRWLHVLRHFEHYLALRRPYTRVIVLDDGTGGDAAAVRLGVPRDRLLFWPNGVDYDWSERPLPPPGGDPALRARLGLAPDRVYALTLGNMAPLKRIDRVIRTIAVLARDAGAPRVDALIGGDGHLRHQLERLAHDLGVGDRVRFLGAVDHATVPDLMAAVDLYVAPHNLTNAGLPTCEAMLCGLPVVAMDAGTTRRTVRDGETGLVVALDDVDAMAAAVARLAADRALARRLGERGRALARERFMSWEDRTRMEVELLEGLADGG